MRVSSSPDDSSPLLPRGDSDAGEDVPDVSARVAFVRENKLLSLVVFLLSVGFIAAVCFVAASDSAAATTSTTATASATQLEKSGLCVLPACICAYIYVYICMYAYNRCIGI